MKFLHFVKSDMTYLSELTFLSFISLTLTLISQDYIFISLSYFLLFLFFSYNSLRELKNLYLTYKELKDDR